MLIGEPVGSCTDLSATVMQPLKQLHAAQFDLAPFSVLVDGNQVRALARLRKAMERQEPERFPDNVLYIYEKQLEEADLIVLNKADLLSAAELDELKASLAERFPDAPMLACRRGPAAGVDAWLDFVAQPLPAGRKVVAVDYDVYAAGEAALGWMNASAKLRARNDLDWQAFAGDLLAVDSRRPPRRRRGDRPLETLLDGARRARGGQRDRQRRPDFAPRPDCPDAARRFAVAERPRHVDPEALRAAVERSLTTVGRRSRRGDDHESAEFLPRPPAADASLRSGGVSCPAKSVLTIACHVLEFPSPGGHGN